MTRWWVSFGQVCRDDLTHKAVLTVGRRLAGDGRVTDIAVDRADRAVALSAVVEAPDALEALRLVRPVFGSALGYGGVPWSGDGEVWRVHQLEGP